MIIGTDCKAIIESMNWEELQAYEDFLVEEIDRHRAECKKLIKGLVFWRHWTKDDMNDYYRASFKLQQTAIYRHRKDIKETKLCIEKAENRANKLEEG